MRALLFQGRSPGSFERSLPIVGKAATSPPRGIASLAALRPPAWELRLPGLPSGDSSERPSFVPSMDGRTLLAALLAPDAYHRRRAETGSAGGRSPVAVALPAAADPW